MTKKRLTTHSGREDKDGNLLPSQAQALKKLGIERPDPSKKKTRYNNPKMAFTEITRNKLMDICEEHGLSIEREPETGGRKHLEKQDYILYKQKKDIEKQKEDIEKERKKARIRLNNINLHNDKEEDKGMDF